MSLRHDRRRRMLADDGASETAADEVEGGDRASRAGGSARAYSHAAHRTLDRPMRDLLPSRRVGIGIVLASGLAAVGALAAGHVWSPSLWADGVAVDGGLLDLSARGSASSWLSSTLLSLAGATSLFLFALRRHRVDDYHGRYRVWLAAAVLCFGLSFAEGTSFSQLVRHLSDRAAAASNVDSAVAWRMVVASAIALCGLRLALEMWRSKGAVAMFSLVALAVVGATAAAHGWLSFVPAESQWAVARSCWLTAYVFLVGTLLVYARYVVLEIEGKVAVKVATARKAKRKKKPQRKRAEVEVEAPRRETPLEHAHVRSPASTLKLATAAEARRDDARQSDDDQRALSRKERRKLRRAA